MTKIELKRKLKHRIDSIEDDMLLEEIFRLTGMEEDEDEEVFHFSDEQLKAVEEAELEYNRGDFISGEEADKIIREWLEKSSGQNRL